MSSNFIKNLCESEKLIDIGSLGTAIQSSTSKWSKENDAQRAVLNKEYKDFAFHTEKEKNPWWQVEFKMPVAVEYIIINNRKRKPFDEIASELSVIAYDDEDNEKLLHSGTVYFGSENQGCPLIIPLKGNVSLKKLRITLLKEDYLHLSNIRVLNKDHSKALNRPIFISNRGDGLGERLKALLNSIVLSEKNNGNFAFSWDNKINKFHAISEKDLMFSKDFQKNHILKRNDISNMNLCPLSKTLAIQAENLKKIDGIQVQQNRISDVLPYPYTDFNSNEYSKAFNKIGFSKEILVAKDHASSVPLSDKVVAIHIRAGDIVFDRYRWEPIFYSKIIPLFLVENTIQNFKNQGFSIVIFGQDDNLCNYLSNKYSALYSKNLIKKDYNDSQIALFDIVLMARSQIIIAGFSGFSDLARWIGGAERKAGYEFVPKLEDKLKAFDQFYENKEGFLYSNDIHPLMKAFSIIQFVYKFQNSISIERSIKLLQQCIDLDSDNFYYKIFLVSLYYKIGKYENGDFILNQELNSGNFFFLEKLAKLVQWNNTTPLTNFIDDFESAVSQGSVDAALVLLLNDIYMKKEVDISFYKKIAEKRKGSISSVLMNEKVDNIS